MEQTKVLPNKFRDENQDTTLALFILISTKNISIVLIKQKSRIFLNE